MKMTKENVTKRNHYYPKFLIRNWANKDGKVWLNDIKSNTKKLTPYDNHLFEKSVYDNDTETQTNKDDTELSNFIKKLINDSVDKTQIFNNERFLQLVFKLFARQPALNNVLYNSTKNEIFNVPYLIGAKNDKMFDTKEYKRNYNNSLFTNTNHDISADYVKANYVFYINKTQKPFILPVNKNNNIKTMILPLSQTICVRIMNLNSTQNKTSIEMKEITNETEIENINKILIQNCDKFYISKD